MRNAHWIFCYNFLVFSAIKSLKTFISTLRKLSFQKFWNYLTCKIDCHYECRNADINLKFTTTNGFNFQMMNWLMKCWGYDRPGLTVMYCYSFKIIILFPSFQNMALFCWFFNKLMVVNFESFFVVYPITGVIIHCSHYLSSHWLRAQR